jgi:hypothetical protein
MFINCYFLKTRATGRASHASKGGVFNIELINGEARGQSSCAEQRLSNGVKSPCVSRYFV